MPKLKQRNDHKLLFRNALQSPLGRLGAIGFINNSGGVSSDPMRILGSYALVYLLEGSGIFRDENGFAADVVAGDLMLILPDVAHCYGPTRDSFWNEFYVVFEGDVFDFWRTSALLGEDAPIFHLEPVAHWRKRFVALQEMARLAPGEAFDNDAAVALRQVCALQSILAEASAARHIRRHSGALAQNERDWLQHARSLLAPNATSSTRSLEELEQSHPSLQDVARDLGMSYESFRKKFADLGGVSPGRFRLQQQMDQASEMLLMGNRNKEIAHALGFCDEYHFSRQFKKIVGVSPQQFRKNLSRDRMS